MVSNNVLAGLLIIAIVVSVGGIMYQLSLPRIPITITGQATGTAQVQIASLATISLPTDTVNFGSVQNNEVKNTTSLDPYPFVVRNEGTVDINITINASQLWYGTGATGTSTYYRFNATVNETGSVYNTTQNVDLRSITNMPIGATQEWVANCTKFTNANDEIRVHIFITVPDDEPAGPKSSTVTMTASQAIPGSTNCPNH
ncbi:MAG: hypothetical protein QW818_03705 [Candidatus Aenigmatarchaeota archaeon]